MNLDCMREGALTRAPKAAVKAGLLVVLAGALTACQTTSEPLPARNVAHVVVTGSDSPFPALYVPAIEPLPVLVDEEEAPEAVPTVATDLWWHFRANMHLDLHLSQKRVQQELRWLQRHPQYLHRLQARMQTYLPYMYRQVRLRNLPAELALLPIVESALDVYAFSHGGAAGPWQFIRGTARQYGLDINDWYDGRRDVVASTDAALRYLERLHARFGDWYLALAGYNAGQGNVAKALRRNPKTNFFGLRLPRETQMYVPKLLALAAVIKNPDEYGLELPVVDNEPQFDVLTTHSQFQLTKLSEVTGLDTAELHKWNPALAKWSTPPAGPHYIIVPNALDIASAQAAIDDVPHRDRLDWQEVVVRPGDTLSALAQRHNSDVKAIQTANRVRSHRIRVGQKLLIPQGGGASERTQPWANTAHATYRVQPGDSLWKIARDQNVNLRQLIRTNHIGPKDPLPVGKELRIPGKLGPEEVVRKVRYKVRKGDSLARIAAKFNVKISDITKWNRLDVNRYLQPGQAILLYVSVVGG